MVYYSMYIAYFIAISRIMWNYYRENKTIYVVCIVKNLMDIKLGLLFASFIENCILCHLDKLNVGCD